MSQSTSVQLNITQNHPDFKLSSLENSPPIFKHKLFEKKLDSIKENPEILENYRTVTIKCLYKGWHVSNLYIYLLNINN
jgi:hypothetical protein